jgi:hypothetical protein
MRLPALGLMFVTLVSVCDRDRQDRPGVATTTGAKVAPASEEEVVPANIALDRVVAAQCGREQLCVEVGLAREDSTSCATRASRPSCAGATNVDARLLEECLQAIYTSSCAMDFDARGSLDACRASTLCSAAPK